MKRRLVVIAAVTIAANGASHAAYAQAAGGTAIPADGKGTPETIQIDGSKNPELIPEWSAWGFAFRVIATGSRQLPSSVHEVVSRAEEDMLLEEAGRVQKIDRDCQERVVKLHALLGKEKNDVLDARLRDITLECRWATLHARDRVLEALTSEGAAALAAFVASTKASTSLTIPRKDLARFLEPQ